MESSDGQAEPQGEKRRRRPPLACVACRRRKIRCDRRMPCLNCVRARHSTNCSYVADERVARVEHLPPQGRQQQQPPPPVSVAAQTGVAASYLSPSSSTANSGVGSVGDVAALAERVRSLEKQLAAVLDASKNGNGTRTETQESPPPPTARRVMGHECWQIHPDGQRSKGDLPESDSRADTDSTKAKAMLAKSRYLGSSHWIHGMTLFPPNSALVTFLESVKADKSSEVYQTVVASKVLARSIKAARTPRLLAMDFGNNMPARDLADQLVDAYLRTFEKVHRVLHVPSFRQEYQQYWENPQNAKPVFVIQLQLCMALGTVVHDDTCSLRHLASGWVYEARLWLLSPSEKSRVNLGGLQVLCLIHLAREICGVSPDLVWVSAGEMMRMAVYTGLHRDPSQLPKMPLLTAELRRRLWATMLEILVQSSLEAGTPPLISMDDFDTRPPGNYNDEDLTDHATEVATEQPPHPLATFTDTSVQIALFDTMQVRLEIATHLNSFRSVPSYDKTLALNSVLASTSRSLDALLSLYQAQQPGVSAFQMCAASHIVQRSFLALHLPWLGPARDDPRYFFSRKLCVEVALHNQKQGREHGFQVSDDGDTDVWRDDFGRLLVCGSGGYRYLGTQSLLALTLELIWNFQEGRDAVRSLGVDSSLARPATTDVRNCRASTLGFFGSSSAQADEMVDTLRRSAQWMRARVAAGEVNIKSYLIGKAMFAEIEGLQRGLSDEELRPVVEKAVTEAAVEALGILKRVHIAASARLESKAGESSGLSMDNVNGPRHSFVDGKSMETPAAGAASVGDSEAPYGFRAINDPGSNSSGQLDDWDWDAFHDPNNSFNMNLNLGNMDLIFSDGFS